MDTLQEAAQSGRLQQMTILTHYLPVLHQWCLEKLEPAVQFVTNFFLRLDTIRTLPY